MKKVWVVTMSKMEECDTMRVFDSEEKANVFAKKCFTSNVHKNFVNWENIYPA